jgi:hypothetical protein
MHELNKRAQQNQFKISVLEELDDDALIFLAGHDPAVDTFPHTEEGLTRKNKLESNARRGRLVLERRWAHAVHDRANAAVKRTAWIAGGAAIAGSVVGALIVKFA